MQSIKGLAKKKLVGCLGQWSEFANLKQHETRVRCPTNSKSQFNAKRCHLEYSNMLLSVSLQTNENEQKIVEKMRTAKMDVTYNMDWMALVQTHFK